MMSPRTEEQNQLIRDERRDQILEHATMLFAKNGYGPTKIGDVAKSASLSQGLVYHYFAAKEEMFVAAVAQTIDMSNAAMAWLLGQDLEPQEKIRVLTQRNLTYEDSDAYALRWLLIFQVGFSEAVPPEAKKLLKDNFRALDTVEKIIEEGQKRGQFSTEKSAASLATAYWSLIEGIVFFRAFNAFDASIDIALPDVETILKLFQ